MAATSWDTYDTTDHTCEWAKSPTIPLTPSAEMLLYQTPAPLTEFHQMKKLPDELQVRIYKLSARAHEARLVNTVPKVTGNVVPALMHTCFLSRQTLRKYYARFSAIIKLARGIKMRYAIIINYSKDTMNLDVEAPSAYPHLAAMTGVARFTDAVVIYRKMMSQVKRLMLCGDACTISDEEDDRDLWLKMTMGPQKVHLRDVIAACPQLEILTITIGKKIYNPSKTICDPYRWVPQFAQEIHQIRDERKMMEAVLGVKIEYEKLAVRFNWTRPKSFSKQMVVSRLSLRNERHGYMVL